jgi:hypothetical protein
VIHSLERGDFNCELSETKWVYILLSARSGTHPTMTTAMQIGWAGSWKWL